MEHSFRTMSFGADGTTTFKYENVRPAGDVCSQCGIVSAAAQQLKATGCDLGLSWCTRCHSAVYCDAQCQAAARKAHRPVCFGRPAGAATLGRGALSWNPQERKSDRYGEVSLYVDSGTVKLTPPPSAVGRTSVLTATVFATHPPSPLGDLFHKVGPSVPTVGERVILGSGALELREQALVAAVTPLDNRPRFRLDMHALYRVAHNEVELWWEPVSTSSGSAFWDAPGAKEALAYIKRGAPVPPTAASAEMEANAAARHTPCNTQ